MLMYIIDYHIINTISTGGSLVNSCLALVGEDAYRTIESINAMIKNANASYLLCAQEKFNKKYFHNLCHVDDIDGVIHE